ncbi:MAG: hypothetical protein EXX96DRAFT_651801 [Benjaminiella poitrasii]|nr:MAG: hypothetical protein EXX96DRAFT_651801 [Benjaminiella poitrasii]
MNNSEEFGVGTVLFNAGDKQNALDWDDSELIEHWDRTVEAYRNKYSKQPSVNKLPFHHQRSNRIQKKNLNGNKSIALNRKTNTNTSSVPPRNTNTEEMPSEVPSTSNQQDLSNLMMAWYYCGYYTGLYRAQQQASEQ